MEMSFSELRSKMVVNLTDGRKLGHIIDLIFEQSTAKIMGIVVPGSKGSLFKGREDLFIPYHCICKIGFDTILVELHSAQAQQNNNQVSTNQYVTTNALTYNNKSEKVKKYTTYSPDDY